MSLRSCDPTLIAGLLLAVATLPLAAQTDAIFTSAERDFASGKYVEAEKEYAQALDQAYNRLGNESERAKIAVRRAEVLLILGNFKDAQQLLQNAPADPSSPLPADLVRAEAEAALGQYASAQMRFNGGLTQAQAQNDGALEARFLLGRGELLTAMANYAGAEADLKKAAAFFAQNPGPQSPEALTAAADLGDLERYRDHLAPAQQLYEQVSRAFPGSPTGEQPLAARAEVGIAELELTAARYAEARKHLTHAEQLCRKLGQSPAYLAFLESSAHVDLAEKKLKPGRDASVLVRLRSELLGDKHPATSAAIRLEALAKNDQGQTKDALSDLQKVAETERAGLGNDHPDLGLTLFYIGSIQSRDKQSADADKNLAEALRIDKAALGPDSLTVARILIEQGALLDSAQKYGDENRLYTEALRIESLQLAPNHPLRQDTSRLLGMCAFKLEKYDQAQPLLTAWLAARPAVSPAAPPSIESLEVRQALAQMDLAGKRYPAAESGFRTLRADWAKAPGAKAAPPEIDLGLADAYYFQQKYKDAAPLYANVAPRLPASRAAVEPWERLADSYSKQRLNAEAADAWKHALDLRKSLVPDDAKPMVALLFSRGLALLETSRMDDADSDLREWLPLRLRQPDALTSEETQALDRISQRLMAAMQYGKAEPYLRQLLTALERPGTSSALLSRTRISLAEACAAQGKNKEAATFYEVQAARENVLKRTKDAQKYLLRAKELREKDASDPSALVATLEDLAAADVTLRQLDDAKALDEQARKSLSDLGYQDDWRVAVALKGLGDVALQQGLDLRGKGDETAQQSFDTALAQYNQANDIIQKLPSTPRRVRAALLFQLGTLASYNKKPDEATKYFDDCLTLAIDAQSADPPPVDQLDAIAQFYVRSQRFDDAEMLYQRTLEIRGKIFGEKSVEYAWGLQALTDFYIARQSPKAAETGEKALRLFESTAGPESDEAAMGLQELASAYRQSGNVPQAIQSLERALDILRKSGPIDRNQEQLMLAELGAYYRGQKDYPKTLATYQRMAQLWEDQGMANANYQSSLHNLAVAYEDAKDHVHGEETFQRLRVAVKGRPDAETRLLQDYGEALKRNGITKEGDRLLKEAKSDRK